MKDNCVLCGAKLASDEQRYIQYGNFCPSCTRECSIIASYFPYEPHRLPDEEIRKLENSKSIKSAEKLARYYRSFERYESDKEAYERLSDIFQRSLQKKPAYPQTT